MKKVLNLLCLMVVSLIVVGCTNDTPTPTPPPTPVEEKTRILDKDGNYGGSLDESLYGQGAPLNGMYDSKESGYYENNDYYNMKSTSTRTIFPKFATYQQTMADTSGLACALMILNYSGDDVYNKYTELELVKKYEQLNNETVYGNGTTAVGLEKVFNDLNYDTRIRDYVEVGSDTGAKIENFNKWALNHLNNGRFIMVRFQDGMEFGWHIIIGMDTMGGEYSKNNVLIMADPYDNLDHSQDGYYVTPSSRFYRWWQNVAPSGEITDAFDYLVVAPKQLVRFERVEETVPTKTVPELHLLLNEDGSYGGTRDAGLYGVIPEKNGETDHLDSIYYAFPDYYNMENTESRIILSGYQAFQQTMASSCGICSALSVLNYYGEDIKVWNEVWLVNKYEEVNGSKIYGNGIGSIGMRKLMEALGYTATAGSYSAANYVDRSSMIFQTYEEFLVWVQENLAKGTPLPVSMRPLGGHWEVIIGIDTMGTDYIYDDVLVLADSHDTTDHYQDGYNTYSAALFYRQWYNGSFTYNQQHCYFDKKQA